MYMNKKDKFRRMLFAGTMAASVVVPFNWSVPEASADSYQSDTKTDANLLDYVERHRREERENAKSQEQLQLLKDAHNMRDNLREPLDPTKNVPVAVEGDDLYYNQVNGDVRATGNVIVTSLDARRFLTDEAIGNLKATTVQVDGKARMLQLTPGQLSIVMTGYKTQYNYTAQTGKMEGAYGKVGEQYVKASRIEFYPDKVILFNATETKCSAKHPDYRLQAGKIEYYPNEYTVYYKLSVYAGDIPVFSTAKKTVRANEDGTLHLPKVGYSSDDGFWIQDRYDWQPINRVDIYADLKYQTKYNFHGNFGVGWNTKSAGNLWVRSGYFEDSNNNWVRKSPVFNYSYGYHFKTLPLSLSLGYERGSWYQDGRRSMHTGYSFSVNPDPIKLGSWLLLTNAAFGITQESYNDSDKRGWKYNSSLLRDFDKRWAYYLSYHYDYDNAENSVFDFDVPDYARRLSTGISYRFDDVNRVVAGWAWDMDNSSLRNIDYYWYRDIHCAQLIFRYRPQEDRISVRLQFTPW